MEPGDEARVCLYSWSFVLVSFLPYMYRYHGGMKQLLRWAPQLGTKVDSQGSFVLYMQAYFNYEYVSLAVVFYCSRAALHLYPNMHPSIVHSPLGQLLYVYMYLPCFSLLFYTLQGLLGCCSHQTSLVCVSPAPCTISSMCGTFIAYRCCSGLQIYPLE